MRRLPRWAIGVGLILAGVAFYLTAELWLQSRNFSPVRMPISIANGTLRTAPFEVNISDGYNIDIWIDQYRVFDAGEHDHPECAKCCGYHGGKSLKTRWQLFRGGSLVGSGETAGSHLGSFAGRGTYSVLLDFPGASPCWELGNPELMVYTYGNYERFSRNVSVCSFVLICGGVLLLFSPLTMRMMGSYAPGEDAKVEPGFKSQNAESRRRERLPLKKRMSMLPDRSVIFGAPVLVMLIVMLEITSPWPSKGIYVTSVPAPVGTSPNLGSDAGVVVEVEFRNHDWRQGVVVYRVQGNEVAKEELRDAVMRELSRRRPGVVYIYGASELPFSDVAYVVDAVNGLQARPVLVGK